MTNRCKRTGLERRDNAGRQIEFRATRARGRHRVSEWFSGEQASEKDFDPRRKQSNDIACEAWNKLIEQPWKIMSIGYLKSPPGHRKAASNGPPARGRA